ncbi:hypothetical protein, partial [Xenorhabdus bovienii]|uniref:hypothetical protein n=1 Tax=Xenorhabdus bovienii TaxID=40576 RepID=UPI0023B2A653
GCKKAGYKAATYLSELAQWKPLQTGRVHIKYYGKKELHISNHERCRQCGWCFYRNCIKNTYES